MSLKRFTSLGLLPQQTDSVPSPFNFLESIQCELPLYGIIQAGKHKIQQCPSQSVITLSHLGRVRKIGIKCLSNGHNTEPDRGIHLYANSEPSALHVGVSFYYTFILFFPLHIVKPYF